MIKESSLIVCIALTSIVSAAAPQPQSSLPPCQAAPGGAPQAVVDCFDQACKAYQIAWSECDSNECRQAALFDYVADLMECTPHRRVGASEWATIWYMDGAYGVAFDTSEVPQRAARFEF